jgi:hypothetical protein
MAKVCSSESIVRYWSAPGTPSWRELADDAADRVHLDPAIARLTAKLLVAHTLHAAPADLEAGKLEQRIGAAPEILLGHCADIADDMRERVIEGIVSGRPGVRLDARQVGAVDVEGRELLPGQILGNGHRHEGGLARDLFHDAGALAIADRNDLADRIERLGNAADLLLDQHDPIVEPVLRDRHAEAIEDTAARRCEKAEIDPVVLGEGLVLSGFDDLQVIEPAGEDRHQHGLAAANHGRAPREGLEPRIFRACKRHNALPTLL